jgi:DNA-binding transcriptional LysR family regulator
MREIDQTRWPMPDNLDIVPLRSLVAVADHGGFQRAATHLHLSQSAVSHHLRRLEEAVGSPIVERSGRGSRFTPAGERLLARARDLLAMHDEILGGFGVVRRRTLVVGTTEHAAAQLLPLLRGALAAAAPDLEVRYRIDRGTRLRDALVAGGVDLALLLHPHEGIPSVVVGDLDLRWYAAPTWQLPSPGAEVPLVAFDNPCALRKRALEVLADGGYSPVVGLEAPHLAGVQAAVTAGFGVALMATLGTTPAGLVETTGLPAARPLPLHACSRGDLPEGVKDAVVDTLTAALSTGWATSAESALDATGAPAGFAG